MTRWRWPRAAYETPAAGYELPALHGGRTPTVEDWRLRRDDLVSGLAEYTYGFTPDGGSLAGVTVMSRQPLFDARAMRTDVMMTVAGPRGTLDVPLAVFQPTEDVPAGGSPVFLGLNIVGNHAIPFVPGVHKDGFMPVSWPIRRILDRGFALATAFYDTIEPDADGAAWSGVRALFDGDAGLEEQGPTQWGALGAWAWGLSRALEAMAGLDGIDSTRVVVHGHSRLGMAALWAAAQDERFAAAISNQSGLGGASLTRHIEGEDIAYAAGHFPHWFCGNYGSYGGRDSEFPIDQHQLLALIAPRPLLVCSADLDRHADPEGEFLATLHASPIYELHGLRGTLPAGHPRSGFELAPGEAALVPPPIPGQLTGGTLAYHIRSGPHGVLERDWPVFCDFAVANGI